MVEANMIESAERQKRNHGGQNTAMPVVGQKVLLDDPARGKLDHHWTGPWEVISVKEPLTLELQMGSAKRVVHINRVRPLLIGDLDRFSSCGRWSPLCLITMRVHCQPKIFKMMDTQLDAQLLEVDGLLGVRTIRECQETPD